MSDTAISVILWLLAAMAVVVDVTAVVFSLGMLVWMGLVIRNEYRRGKADL